MPAGETPRNLMNVPFQSFFWSSLRMTEDTWGALRAAAWHLYHNPVGRNHRVTATPSTACGPALTTAL